MVLRNKDVCRAGGTNESTSIWKEAWLRYKDVFEGVLPSPRDLGQSEDQGVTEFGLSRIPALLIYTPLYYLLFFFVGLVFYPLILFSILLGF